MRADGFIFIRMVWQNKAHIHLYLPNLALNLIPHHSIKFSLLHEKIHTLIHSIALEMKMYNTLHCTLIPKIK